MKKITALIFVLIFVTGTLPVMAKVQREVWEPSPGITCGVTSSEIMFNKAIHMGTVRMYQLSSIGSRYYLGVIEEQREDGGSSGKVNTSFLTYYSILETDDGFIILGIESVNNEYRWDGLEGVLDISKSINTSYYTSQGYEAPYYIINPHNKYTYSQWDEYAEYIFIGSNGSIAMISDWCDYGLGRTPMLYENKLYTGENKYYSDGRSYFYYLSDKSTEATQRRIIGIKNNAVVDVESPASVAADSITAENGYTVYREELTGNLTAKTEVKDWWPHYLDNKFSDGRYVKGHWTTMGSNLYEIWYDIYDKDGNLISTGASDFSTVASSTLRTKGIQGFVVNDTKIVLCLSDLDNTWFNEFYRTTVVTENDDGIIEIAQPIGKKNIVSPSGSDTTPVNKTIDFMQDNLSLGFNIKNNIISKDKLNNDLKNFVSAVRLDSIVIVAKPGSISGVQNAGVDIGGFDENDYSFGSAPIRIYTNGQNFCWYCTEPECLEVGTYNTCYPTDDKLVYVTIKVIAPPSNDSYTTVVF